MAAPAYQQEGGNYWVRNLPDELSDEQQQQAGNALKQDRPALGSVQGGREGGAAAAPPRQRGGLLAAFPFGWTSNLFRRKRASADDGEEGETEDEEGEAHGKKKQLSLQQRRQQARRTIRLVELIMDVDIITIPIMLLDWHKDLILGNLFKIDMPGVAPLSGWEMGVLLLVDLVVSLLFLSLFALFLAIVHPCTLLQAVSEGFLKFLKPVIDLVCATPGPGASVQDLVNAPAPAVKSFAP